MIPLAPAPPELGGRQHVRIDFASQLFGKSRKALGKLTQSEGTNHHQINIAVGFLNSAGDGPEHEGNLDLVACECLAQHISHSARL